MIPRNAKKRKLNTVPILPAFFSVFLIPGAGWSSATLHRQVEVCAFHHNLSLLSLLFVAPIFPHTCAFDPRSRRA